MSKVEYHRIFPELPSKDEMVPPALVWMLEKMNSSGSYHTDDLKAFLAEHFHVNTSLTCPRSKKGAFGVYVNVVTSDLTQRGLHRGERKVYALTPVGRQQAERYAARFRRSGPSK